MCRNYITRSASFAIEKEENGVDGFGKANGTIKRQNPLSRFERARRGFGENSPTIAPRLGRATSKEGIDEGIDVVQKDETHF